MLERACEMVERRLALARRKAATVESASAHVERRAAMNERKLAIVKRRVAHVKRNTATGERKATLDRRRVALNVRFARRGHKLRPFRALHHYYSSTWGDAPCYCIVPLRGFPNSF